MKDLKTIIFDFDGVLVESVGIKDKAFEKMFAGYTEHFDAIMHYHRTHNAVIRFEKFEYIYKEILNENLTTEKKESLSKQFSQLVVEKIVNCPGVEGAEDFLKSFYGRIPLYIVSMNPEEELKSILRKRKIDTYFKDLYPYPWEKELALADILKKESITADQALYIGDSPEDYKAAKVNNMHFIGRKSNKSFENVDIPISDNFLEILNIIERHKQYVS